MQQNNYRRIGRSRFPIEQAMTVDCRVAVVNGWHNDS